MREHGIAAGRVQITEMQLRSIFAAMAEGITVQTRTGVIVDANPAAELILGLSRDQLLGRASLDPEWMAIHEDGSPFPGHDHPSMVTIRTGLALRDQVMGVQVPQGGLRWLSINSQPVENDGSADAIAVVTTFIDITNRRNLESELTASSREIEDLYDHSPCGYHSLDEGGTFLRINQTELDWLGCLREDVVGKLKLTDFLTEKGAALFRRVRPDFVRSGSVSGLEYELVGRNGLSRHVAVSATAIRDASGRFLMSRGVMYEISDRVSLTRELRIARDRLASAADYGLIGIWDHDLVLDTWWHSPRHDQIFGYSSPLPDWSLQTLLEHLVPEDREDFARAYLESGKGGSIRLEVRIVWPDASVHWILVDGRAVLDELGRPARILGTVTDITSTKAALAQLSDAARRDKLTGLANRMLFLEQLELSIGRFRANGEERFAIFFLDFDRFKLVNDTLGHGAGDELLRQITQRLRLQLRASDSTSLSDGVLSRFGGDEFLLLINRIRKPEDAILVAERLLQALKAPYTILGREVHSTASIGIVLSEQSADSAENMVRNADLAMYEAKRAGRDCWILFDESMHTRLTRDVTIESGLRRAIDSSEMYLLYQPIVDLSTGRIVSAEALLRWEHPTLGALSPTEFIPIAEESGLIVRVGRWVQKEACQALARWRALDPLNAPASVSVNVSRAELSLGDKLLVQLRETLEQSGLAEQSLTLEVTEREVMRNPEATIKLMHALRGIGIRMSMDDFGTGTSSLGMLRDYPFDYIKIDRSFITDLSDSKDVLAVIHATVELIENLGMISVAEGVETEAQAALLYSLGCRLAQGYLFSRPIPFTQMMAVIAAGDTRLAAGEKPPG